MTKASTTPQPSDTVAQRETEAALMLAALGNETRLRIYRQLVRAGEAGLAVGDVQARLAIPASTLSHHLGALRQAGLISQRREGRTILCAAVYPAMNGLIAYLTDECCADDAVEPPEAVTTNDNTKTA